MRSTDPAFGYDVVATILPPDSTSYRDTGLIAGQHYFYFVGVTYPLDWNDDGCNYSPGDVVTPGP